MNSNAGDSQMALLMQELKVRFPNASLNHLSQKEAFKIMNVMNPALIVAIILIIIFGAIGVGIYFAANSS